MCCGNVVAVVGTRSKKAELRAEENGAYAVEREPKNTSFNSAERFWSSSDLHLQPQPKVECFFPICEAAKSVHKEIHHIVQSYLILQHTGQCVYWTYDTSTRSVVLFAVIAEEVRCGSEGDWPICEIPVRLFKRIFSGVDDWNDLRITSVDLVWGCADEWSVF